MYDAAIIGAGVVGASVARELSRFDLKTLVIEKEHDVAMGASRANSGIVHAGYDAKPGSKKAQFNIAGTRMFDVLSAELDIPFRRNGSIVIATDGEGTARLRALKAQGLANGVRNLEILTKDEALKLEPNITDSVVSALHAPDGGIVCPYEMTIALSENAAYNGVEFMLGRRVVGICRQEGFFKISTCSGEVEAKVVVNAAGVYSDEINNMLSENKLKIVPRRGEYVLYDKSEGGLVGRTVFQLPTVMGKGVLVVPTVHGNLLVGPTSVDIEDKDDTATTKDGLETVQQRATLALGQMPKGNIIANFAGLRAHHPSGDFIVEEAADVPGLVNLCGIASPGLTAAPAIGKWAAEKAAEILGARPRESFNPVRRRFKAFASMSENEREKAIAENPDYGRVICRCEHVTKAEIVAALGSPLKANSLDALKRRTRAGMGRCQGGFCWMRLVGMIAEECGIDITQVTKAGAGTNILIERNKASMGGRA